MATTSTASTPNLSTYGDCVSSLRTSLSFLESSVNTLGNGVEDFPRLVSVLKTVRVRPPRTSVSHARPSCSPIRLQRLAKRRGLFLTLADACRH